MIYKTYSRRYFVKTMALGSAALGLGCANGSQKYIAPIGLQLYTVRKVIFDNFEGTIKKIADMGYKGVETWGGLTDHIDLTVAAKTIREAGLEVFGCHCDLPVDDKRGIALQMAEAYQSDRLIFWGGSREDLFSDNEQMKKTIEMYNTITNDFKTQGIKFGIHNHAWEFEPAEDGTIPFFYYLENLNKDIFFEIDTYWAKKGGYDPVEAVKKAGPRAPFLHIKDGPAVAGEDDIHVPAGKGSMDFPAIVKAGGKNIKWMIAEFDDYDIDIFDGLQQTYNYLTSNKLAIGNV